MSTDASAARPTWHAVAACFALSVVFHLAAALLPRWPSRPPPDGEQTAPGAKTLHVRPARAAAMDSGRPADAPAMNRPASPARATPRLRQRAQATGPAPAPVQPAPAGVPQPATTGVDLPPALPVLAQGARASEGPASGVTATPLVSWVDSRPDPASVIKAATAAARHAALLERSRAEMASFLELLRRLPAGPDLRCVPHPQPRCDPAAEPQLLALWAAKARHGAPAMDVVREGGRWRMEPSRPPRAEGRHLDRPLF